ncbi:hypothetical protein BPORC_1815 [Bifidobacterium porcinum]|nr:hypothetical protein BPORC_1815 [Bifidobacterium porcinum]
MHGVSARSPGIEPGGGGNHGRRQQGRHTATNESAGIQRVGTLLGMDI